MRGSTLLAILAALGMLSVVTLIALVVILTNSWMRAEANQPVALIKQIRAFPALAGNESSTGGWHGGEIAEPAGGTTCVTVAADAFDRR